VPVYHQPARLFTLEEANDALPGIRELLKEMKRRKEIILSLQARADIAEMTGSGDSGEKADAQSNLGRLDLEINGFHEVQKKLNRLGCELKDIDKGQVDFYAQKEGEIVFLCWTQDEEQVGHWHFINDGFEERKLLSEGRA
jgi:hypothetical protein